MSTTPQQAGQPQVTTQLPLPTEFDGGNGPQQSELWPKWIRRFERYRVASGLTKKPDHEQVSTLLYAMGDCADDILITLRISEDTADYDEVVQALNKHYEGRRNIIVERARFNKRKQQPGEPMDVFIQDLYRLADHCEYAELKDSLIRDRIVVGVTDDKLSDNLQSKSDLTLDRAVQLCRQAESRKQNRDIVRGETQRTQVDHLRSTASYREKKGTSTTGKSKSAQSNPHPSQDTACQWCGKERHKRSNCPAKDTICANCKKQGHYKAVCRSPMYTSTRVHEVQDHEYDHEVQDHEYDNDLPFLGEISSNKDYWNADISVNGHNTRFKLDTGATVSVVSDNEPWLSGLTLISTSQSLRGPGNTPLPVLGMLNATLQYRHKQIRERVFIIKDQKCSLLSKTACVELGLIQRINEVQTGSTSADFRAEFPKLFTGLGRLMNEYHITLRQDAKPVRLCSPRKIPHPLLPKVKSEIDKMITQGVISPVTVPTAWCSGIVPVPKSNGNIRICVDLTQLNKGVERELHPMSSVDESLAKLGKSKIFTKLDANSGFWQLPLDDDSKLLTTFITPFGRYCFNRLPFGISSAPEIFQRTMSLILEGLDGVICHMDDVLIHSTNQTEHDSRVRATLQRLQDAGLTLNDKCEFSKGTIKFLGHIVNASGLSVDTRKTTAIAQFPVPTNITELQRFMGMVNQLGKFIPSLAEFNEPLRQLLRKDNCWYWGDMQQKSFQRIKDMLVSSEILAHYDPNRPTIIAADASQAGIGAVLLQIQDDGNRRPICYASRSLSDTEKRYAVIEKEALATTWACEKFNEYVLGLHFTVETDHKPLVPLLSTTELSKMPPRILRFRLRLMRFNPIVMYVPGKHQLTADALSRAPVGMPGNSDIELIAEIDNFASSVLHALPATSQRLRDIGQAQRADEECSQIRQYCSQGWPTYMPHSPLLRQYWQSRNHLAIVDDLLLYDQRIVIPRRMRLEILDCIHQGHLGITKCRARSQTSVWWPGLSKSIEQLVTNCTTCAKERPEIKEPLMSASFPSRPWERLGTDLFQHQGKVYLIVIDYYSRWMEIKQLNEQKSQSVINVLKQIFAVHGIPDVVMSDNGPQFSAETFQQFAATYGFTHVTSSPRYPQANGEAERAVRTAKALLKKNSDPYLALLTYRSTPLQNGLSPSELLMGRRLRTQLPVLPMTLVPSVPNHSKVRGKEDAYRSAQENSFNRRHSARELPTLRPGDPVWIRDQKRTGQIVEKTHSPRSYIVKSDQGTVRRNRGALVHTPSATPETTVPMEHHLETPNTPTITHDNTQTPATPDKTQTNSPVVETKTRSGRIVKPPVRLDL